MSCTSLMFSLFLLSPCEGSSGTEVSEAVASAMSNPQRPAEDIVNDANRKPDQALSFFHIKPGMTVLDLFSGCGGLSLGFKIYSSHIQLTRHVRGAVISSI